MQMRIDAIKELLFVLSDDTKKQGQSSDTLRNYIEKNKGDMQIELLMSKESLEGELKELSSQNYAIESQINLMAKELDVSKNSQLREVS